MFSLGEEMFKFVVLPCFDQGRTVPVYICIIICS